MDSVNWEIFFNKFLSPCHRNDDLHKSVFPVDQFTFLVKDLLSIRDNKEVSLEEANRSAKLALARPHWGTSSSTSSTRSVGEVIAAIQAGLFEEDGIDSSYFMDMSVPMLVFTDSFEDELQEEEELLPPPPLLQRVSSTAAVGQQQQWRASVGIATASQHQRDALQLARSSTSERQDRRPPPLAPRISSSNNSTLSTHSATSSNSGPSTSTSEAPITITPTPALAVCNICFDEVPAQEVWGGGRGGGGAEALAVLPKSCDCDTQVCLPCLAMSARADIQNGAKPACPHMTSFSPPRRCTSTLDASLLGQLLKNQCSFCDVVVPDASSASASASTDVSVDVSGEGQQKRLMDVGCALDTFHKFCTSCLRRHVVEAITQSRTLPKCLRSAECKFSLDEPAIRAILASPRPRSFSRYGYISSDDEEEQEQQEQQELEVDDLVERWQEIRLETLQGTWRGNKKCPTPDCSGFLRASLDLVRRAERSGSSGGDGVLVDVDVQCTNCHQSYCWSCQGTPHPSRSCASFRTAGVRWQQFLQKYGSESARKRLGDLAADKKYFLTNVKSGDLKRCPKCSRLIQKMQGCNDMHCGRNYDGSDVNQQSGCGVKFRWSDVPKMSMQDLHHDSHTLELDINSSDAHFDPLALCALGRAVPVRCEECRNDIIGAKFECVSCPPSPQTPSHENRDRVRNRDRYTDRDRDRYTDRDRDRESQGAIDKGAPALCLACVLKHIPPDATTASATATAGVHSSAGLSLNDVRTMGSSSGSSRISSSSKHMNHVFDIINPPSMKPVVTVMFASVLTSGEVLVYNIPSMLAPLSSSGSASRSSNSGGGDTRLRLVDDETLPPNSAHVCRVDVTTDGLVVFADSFGRGFDWLSLESVCFKIDGRGLLGEVQLEEGQEEGEGAVKAAPRHTPAKYRSENPLRPLAVAHLSATTAKLHNAHVKLLLSPPSPPAAAAAGDSKEGKKEEGKKDEGKDEVAQFEVTGNIVARIAPPPPPAATGKDSDGGDNHITSSSSSSTTTLPLQDVISIAVGLRHEKVISLNHIRFQTRRDDARCPRVALDEHSGVYREEEEEGGGMVQLFGQRFASLSDSSSSGSGSGSGSRGGFARGAELFRLPEGFRPRFGHDFLVVGAGADSSGEVRLAVVRVLPCGRVLFQGEAHTHTHTHVHATATATQGEGKGGDASSGPLLRLCLDTIYFSPPPQPVPPSEEKEQEQEVLKEEASSSLQPPLVPSPSSSSSFVAHPLVLGRDVQSAPVPGSPHCQPPSPSSSSSSFVAPPSSFIAPPPLACSEQGPELQQGASVLALDEDALELARLGGYTGCSCSAFPCSHIFEASERGARQAGKVASSSSSSSSSAAAAAAIDFGQASALYQRSGTCCFLTGQAFKRKSEAELAVMASHPSPHKPKPAKMTSAPRFGSNSQHFGHHGLSSFGGGLGLGSGPGGRGGQGRGQGRGQDGSWKTSAGFWSPGDVIARLPEHLRPASDCSFVVAAGAEAIQHH